MEASQVSAALSAMRNKTDKTYAKGIAQNLRIGWFGVVHMNLIIRNHFLRRLTDFLDHMDHRNRFQSFLE